MEKEARQRHTHMRGVWKLVYMIAIVNRSSIILNSNKKL